MLLSCFLSIGWYSLALSISQDKKLRETIRKEVKDESKLLDNIGKAEMEQKVQNRVMKIVREQEQTMKEEGITKIKTSLLDQS